MDNSSFQFQTAMPALLIIDWQQAIDHFGELARSHPEAESACSDLLAYWRQEQRPVIHIRHSSRFSDSPYHQSSPWFDFKTELEPMVGELVLSKRENCAFAQTELEEILRARGVEELVFTGVLLNNSVDATLRVAAGLGFKSYLVPECCPAQAIDSLSGEHFTAEQVHDIFLSNLADEYCQLLSAEQAIRG
ncbi:isochorismatase family protein [uncultured Pseudoteredinibacter sp.]|uniref:isochorismatase family protein n=1 Tax=uncultured Pseudoteredinibacter sp. TaxID=1641701 RepID=UPI0026235A09|nr:isochorismatase family protein [uncultured Pseudoteredinibacter sp.]